jgi:hypothetical protein
MEIGQLLYCAPGKHNYLQTREKELCTVPSTGNRKIKYAAQAAHKFLLPTEFFGSADFSRPNPPRWSTESFAWFQQAFVIQ